MVFISALILFCWFVLVPDAAQAHMPVSTGAFEGGLTHPLMSLEHALVLVAIGLWSGMYASHARLVIPLSLIAAFWIGLVLCVQLITLPHADFVNYVSLIVFGGIIAMRMTFDYRLAAILVFVFGLFHGYANATAMPSQWDAQSFAAGSVVASISVIWLAHLVTAHFHQFPIVVAIRVVGSWIAATGMLMIAFTFTQSQ